MSVELHVTGLSIRLVAAMIEMVTYIGYRSIL